MATPQSRSNRLRFSREEDDRLIKAVSKSPVLYDLKHKFYHDHCVRDDTWEEVAKITGKSVRDCKVRWKSLKDVYRKRTREMAESSNKRQCKWEHMEVLKFLDNVVFTRSVPQNQNQNVHNRKWDDPDKPEFVTLEATVEERIEHPDFKIELDEQDLESETTYNEILMIDDVDNREPMILQPETRHPIQMETAQNKVNREPVPAGVQQPGERHPIQIFFESMARTVMEFPPPLAVKTKMEVLQVISKAELELWKEHSGSSQT